MTRLLSAALALALLSACGDATQTTEAETQAPAEVGPWGVDLTAVDETVRPQDDLYRYVNGTWLATFEIPADRSNYGVFTRLIELSEERVRAIIEEAAAAEAAKGTEQQKVGDLFASFMDEARAEELGVTPIQNDLDRIAAAASRDELVDLMAEGWLHIVSLPIGGWVDGDYKNPGQYIFYMTQSGLGLPDRDYYLKGDEKFAEARAAYAVFVEKVFSLAGIEGSAEKAAQILALETRLAETYWASQDRRDRSRTYNKVALADLPETAPGFPWARFIDAAGIVGDDSIIAREPSAFEGFARAFAEEDLDVWKGYLTLRWLSAFAPYLNGEMVDAHFEFFGKSLNGTPELRDRWKRGVSLVGGNVGEAVGKLYVDKHFPPEAKAGADELVANLRAAYGERIRGLEWMGEETKAKALEKLAQFTPKIGYPSKWRDYSALEIEAGDLVGNVKRAALFETNRQLARIGGPIDRTEWLMTPQTVNAYYLPSANEIAFPAAILQPPFFDPNADPAVNYGSIGAVIGHEIGHGFDDQGSKFDGTGALNNWWTEEDRARFTERAQMLVEQFNGYEALEGMNVNGQLTLGENIGDLGGVVVAYRAYRMALGDTEAPVLDGLTGDQRFFMAYAQSWRGLHREENLRQRLVADPHAPWEFRTNGIVKNVDEFHAAFGTQPGDGLWLAPQDRVRIW